MNNNEIITYRENSIVIGPFDIEPEINESLMEKFEISENVYGICNIAIFNDEGQNIPHFHIIYKSNPKTHVCPELLKAEYFIHDNHTKGTLSTKGRKALNEIMDLPMADFGNIPLWNVLCNEWKRNNIWSAATLEQIQKTRMSDIFDNEVKNIGGVHPNYRNMTTYKNRNGVNIV